MHFLPSFPLATLLLSCLFSVAARAAAPPISVADFPSAQAAIDANPGRMIHFPEGETRISEALAIRAAGTRLAGPGRIVQADADQAIIVIQNAEGVEISDLTLTRPEAAAETTRPAIEAVKADRLRLDRVRVLDNHSAAGSIRVEESRFASITECEVINYKRIAIDDRTASEHYGYAFRCIDGTGIVASRCRNLTIRGNRIIENRLLPTRAIKEAEHLGDLVDGAKPSHEGSLAAAVFARKYAQNWHQGSGLIVTAPEESEFVAIEDNYIQNAAQGIDLHADRVRCSGNAIDHCMIGIKAMHGSRHIVISENLITHADLWGLYLAPGTSSHAAGEGSANAPPRPPNGDGRVIISHNIFTAYGFGHEYWNWGGATNDQGGSYVIRLDRGQLKENPPLSGVIISENIVEDVGPMGVIEDGKLTHPGSRYRYALCIDHPGPGDKEYPFPERITLQGNQFDPGALGETNVPNPSP